MASAQRDDTHEWVIPVDARPPTVLELVQRVDIAIATAQAAEEAALEIGAASLEAAQQARRAAELAERASLAAARGSASPPAPLREVKVVELSPPQVEDEERDQRMRRFGERADRVAARLGSL